jgi:hypothetical protein
MAATITPGYDFGVNETPDFSKMMLQAKVTIADLGIDDLQDANFIGVVRGTESGTTGASLPGEAWLWADPTGNIWIESNFDLQTTVSLPRRACYLSKAGGGWATVRYATDVQPTGIFTGVGMNVEDSDHANRLDSETVYWQPTIRDFAAAAQFFGALHESGQSGLRQMVHGRGLATINLATFAGATTNHLFSDATSGWEGAALGALAVPEAGQSVAVDEDNAGALWWMLHAGGVFH